MKVKTSITLPEDLLGELSEIANEFKNKSDLIEQALRLFLKKRLERAREERDLKILNQRAKELNEEAEEILSYQAEL